MKTAGKRKAFVVGFPSYCASSPLTPVETFAEAAAVLSEKEEAAGETLDVLYDEGISEVADVLE